MKNEITVTELKPAEGHSHPTLNIRRKENKGAIFDDYFKVRIQEFQHEIQILFRREYIEKLWDIMSMR